MLQVIYFVTEAFLVSTAVIKSTATISKVIGNLLYCKNGMVAARVLSETTL